jgi:NAD(P)-dependent dehydrogenase (short-subunit alcohol dehydrogenase family)
MLDGKVALVTGVTSGLGRGTATAFVRRGARVVGTGRRNDLGRDLEAELRSDGCEFTFVSGDVTDVADCERMVEATVDAYGRIDVLVNNAGFEGDPPSIDSHEIDEAQWDAVVDTNLKGAFFCCRYAIPHMREQKGGVILNIASINGVARGPARMTAYSSSKAGLIQMSKTLAVEYLFDGIRVNAVIMGGVDTPQAARSQASFAKHLRGPDFDWSPEPTPLDAFLKQEPEQVGGVVALLCSDEARLLTGAEIALDRAMSAGFIDSLTTYMTCSGLWGSPD